MVDRAEVEDSEPAVGQHPEVAGMRVRMKQPDSLGPYEQKLQVPGGCGVAGLLGASCDDLRQGGSVQPLADQDVALVVDDFGNGEFGITFESRGKSLLGLSFQSVVQLLGHPALQLVQDRLDLESGYPGGGQTSHPGHLVEIADECLACARILQLDCDVSAVLPDCTVHLADRRGGGRLVVERDELLPPTRPELGNQHSVDDRGGHRRCGILKPGQRRAVGPGEFLGHGCLKD